jgi:hypothetical protein
MRARRFAGVLLIPLLSASCVVYETQVLRLTPGHGTGRVERPVKVHLLDGSTLVYADGVTLDRDTLRGRGWRYDLWLNTAGGAQDIGLDSVAAMEVYDSVRSPEASRRRTTWLAVGSLASIVLSVILWFAAPPEYL